MSYAILKNGLGWRAVSGPQDVDPDETYSETQPEIVATSLAGNALIASQISALESTITDRRLREAILGIDKGWLSNTNAQIASLRSSMTKT